MSALTKSCRYPQDVASGNANARKDLRLVVIHHIHTGSLQEDLEQNSQDEAATVRRFRE